MITFASDIERYLRTACGARVGEKVLVGVSGGIDSVVLLHILHQLGFAPLVAHFNYRLRGTASDQDEAFVREQAQLRNIPFFSGGWETGNNRASGLQARAREARYAFFCEIARAEDVSFIAVGHHQEDQVETLLLNLFRGTGIAGLAGMQPARTLCLETGIQLIRPLLSVSRKDIYEYALHENLQWREDASNQKKDYTRNWIRHEILPRVRDRLGDAAITHTAETAGLMRSYLQDEFMPQLEKKFQALYREDDRSLDVDLLNNTPLAWQGRLIQHALDTWMPEQAHGRARVDEVKALLEAQTGRRIQWEQGELWRNRDRLVFVPSHAPYGSVFPLSEPGQEGPFQATLFTVPPANIRSDLPDTVWLDADTIRWPLTARIWNAGDRLQPLGMEATKKVSDLLTDRKVETHARQSVYVIAHQEGIAWVAGVEIAHPNRVTEHTSRFLRLSFNESLS